MSYILEALKKSEQERHRGRAPDLQALHGAPTQPAQARRWWPLVLVLALLLNAGLLAVWRPWQAAPAVPPAQPSANPVRTTAPKPSVAPPAMQMQALPPAVAASVASPPVEAPAPATPAQPQDSRVITFSDLPPEVRRGIPEMSFAVHLYSAKPAERMVSINGKMMKEGQEVSPGLKLLEITQDGMVFGYQGYTFKRGVF